MVSPIADTSIDILTNYINPGNSNHADGGCACPEPHPGNLAVSCPSPSETEERTGWKRVEKKRVHR
jgi:hypothetical protein